MSNPKLNGVEDAYADDFVRAVQIIANFEYATKLKILNTYQQLLNAK